MDKEYLKNKIEGLRHHFVESTIHERAIGFYDEAHMTKKMLKIKKKLVSLEMERCQKKIEHKDVTKTDQKIAELNSNLRPAAKNAKEGVIWNYSFMQ